MNGNKTTDERFADLIADVRGEAYARSFRRGLEALDIFARYLAGTRGLTEQQELSYRTALGILMSALDTAPIPHGLREILQAEARNSHAAAVNYLGKRARK